MHEGSVKWAGEAVPSLLPATDLFEVELAICIGVGSSDELFQIIICRVSVHPSQRGLELLEVDSS